MQDSPAEHEKYAATHFVEDAGLEEKTGRRAAAVTALLLLLAAAVVALFSGRQELTLTEVKSATNNLIEGQWNGWTEWTKMDSEGDVEADIYLPPGEQDGECVGGIVAIVIKQGYDKDYKTMNYFHDWLNFGISCAADPLKVIWMDVSQDNSCCQHSVGKHAYKYKATDFNADEYINVTCADNPGTGNKQFIRGFEVRRYETKGVELGAKGRNAMQIRDQINLRPICDFLHNFDPDQYGKWKGIPYGTLKETQGLYCLARHNHRKELIEPNIKQLNIRFYNKVSDNKQTVQFRAKCGMPPRKPKKPKKTPADDDATAAGLARP